MAEYSVSLSTCIKIAMPFAAEYLQKPFTRLSKAMKAKRDLRDPERVHKLRTNTRRVEAIFDALVLQRASEKMELVKRLTKIRRSAGKVRDMDVLTGKAAGLSVRGEENCEVRLLEHLGAERQRMAAELASELKGRRKTVRRALQRCTRKIEPLMTARAASEKLQEAEAQAAAHVLKLTAQLRNFATLDRRNLHEYRKEGKQLRYLLQIPKPPDEALIEGLRAMQDAIGEWHDWEQLLAIARNVLDHGRKCGLIRELRRQADNSFEEALRVANSVRKRFLNPKQEHGPLPLGIVRAVGKLAA